MNLPRIIGITGYAGSGKDTLADHLARTFGYTKSSFASPIKELLNKRFGWTDEQWLDREWKERPAVCGIKWYFPEEARDFDKPALSPRQLAQWLGTEVGRDTFGPDVWVNALFRQWSDAGCPLLVIPDMRFDNEARAVRSNGGVVIRVVRPDATAVNAHVSEKGVSGDLIDLHVMNDGTVERFLREATAGITEQFT